MAGKEKPNPKNKPVAPEVEPSPFAPAQIKKFVKEVKVEFGKIVWPDKKMTMGLAGIVIVMTVIISLYLGSVDMVLGKIISSFL